jgi:SulP family sulfate permease
LDFSLISGIDYSAMEAFQSIGRKLITNSTHMIFCGLGPDIKKIVSSGLFDESDDVLRIQFTHIFENLNQALEWCENILLSTYYQKVERAQSRSFLIELLDIPSRRNKMAVSNNETPRGNEISYAASMVAKGDCD